MSKTIKSYCPACRSKDTVIVGAGGYLTCGYLDCPDPDYLHAWMQEVENARAQTNKIWKREHDYWKDLAERLMQLSQLDTQPKMVVEANPKSQIFIDNPPPTSIKQKGKYMSEERKTFIEKQKQAFEGWMKGSMFMPNDGRCYKCRFDLIKHELDKGNDGSQGVTGCHQCFTSYCE